MFLSVRTMLCVAAVALLLIPPARPVVAQGTTTAAAADTVYEILLNDGSKLIGRIESRKPDAVVVLSTSGIRTEVPNAAIREIRIATGQMVQGEYWLADPNKTRLFFAPTARAVGNGKGYVGTFLVLLPFVAVGIGDHVTIAGGAPILFGEITPVYIAPKLTLIQKSRGALAVGVLSVLGGGDDFDSFGVGFAMGTFGTADNAVTAGVGFGYYGDDIAGQPAIMLGGEARVDRRLKVITENYFVAGESGGIVMGGLRILGDRLSVDVGVMGAVAGGNMGCCLPVLNFAYTFGR